MLGLVEKLLEVIAPDTCLVCGAEGTLICAWCRPDACQRIPSQCYKCQRQTTDFAVCDVCKPKTALRHVWMAAEYDEIASQLVKELKFGYKRSSAKVMAEYMDAVLPYLNPYTIVIHVPTAAVRVRERGFDQAALIAKELARLRNVRHSCSLKRLGKTRQLGARRQERANQLRGAFWVSAHSLFKNQRILLVDDVVTTGATLESAARALKKAGVTQVNAVVFAQAK